MAIPTIAPSREKMARMGLTQSDSIYYQLGPDELIQQTIQRGQGILSDSGALLVRTGTYTGRCPKDKFIVRDTLTKDTVNWNDFNNPFDESRFDPLYRKVLHYLHDREIWVRDCYACADPRYRMQVRVFNEDPWSNLFCYTMFLRPSEELLETFTPDWQVIQAPGFQADPKTDGTRSPNFAIVSFTRRVILIGGTGYTGEIKKGVFSVLNFLLPVEHGVLPMHCSANSGWRGDTAIFFGLSGTGKTTLSTDPARQLIGDDEHGWGPDNIFNFEGGCYAKCIHLSPESEPTIYAAVRRGALVENASCYPGTNRINFSDGNITENTRASYPLHYIPHTWAGPVAPSPKHIFFLTCDAFGVLPPISRLNAEQAMYQFVSGYTAKVAGTETGVTEPKSTFSACFGAPFMPLHPSRYAEMLGERIRTHQVPVWWINTGWTGGGYGVGSRIPLQYTRAIVRAVLEDRMNGVEFHADPVFGCEVPIACPDVPSAILQPRNTWKDGAEYDEQARKLLVQFEANYARLQAGR